MTRRGIHHIGVVDRRPAHGHRLEPRHHPVFRARTPWASCARSRRKRTSRPRARWRRACTRWSSGSPVQGASAYRHRAHRRRAERSARASRARAHRRPGWKPRDMAGPVPYAWLAAGSEGRREQTLKTDQDNGLVYQDPAPELAAAAAAYFRPACATDWRGAGAPRLPAVRGRLHGLEPGAGASPRRVWRGYFESWMETPRPEQVLRASHVLRSASDRRRRALGRDLWQWVC